MSNIIIKYLLVSSILFFAVPVSTLAEENSKKVESIIEVSPYTGIEKTKWWPGNPNPPYGSEDWLFQNYGYNFGSSAPSNVAEGCGLSAVVGGVLGGTKSLFYSWWAGGPITLGAFVLESGAAGGTSFGGCLIVNGIKK